MRTSTKYARSCSRAYARHRTRLYYFVTFAALYLLQRLLLGGSDVDGHAQLEAWAPVCGWDLLDLTRVDLEGMEDVV